MTLDRSRDEVVTRVGRWLGAGRDVLLRADRGMGKSTLLELVRTEVSGRRLPGLLLRAGGSGPLAALLDHPSAPTRARDEDSVATWLAGELAAPRSVLLVDDLDRIDPASLRVVRRALGRTGCRFVATTTADLLRAPLEGPRQLFAVRSPAELWVPAFGLPEIAALVAETLGGPPDAGLVSGLLAQSGGNPGVALALLSSARASGALRADQGRQVDDGRLRDVPADAVAGLLLGLMDDEQLRALEQLALIGPVSPEAAARFVDPALLDDLAEQGRLVDGGSGGAASLLVVAPPALARALRERVSGPRRRRLLATAQAAARGEVVATPEAPRPALAQLLTRESQEDAGFRRWRAETVAAVHERAASAETAAGAAWAADPGVANANAYLAHLVRRPAREVVASVFRQTLRRPDDADDDVVAFEYYRIRWSAWDRATGSGAAESEAGGRPVGSLGELEGLKDRLVASIRDGEPAERVADSGPLPVPAAAFRGGPELLRTAALLEVGRPDLALRVLDRAENWPDTPRDEMRHYRAALRGESLCLLGRLDEALDDGRHLLGAAYDAADVFGIRVHATVLAEVLCVSGAPGDAWRVLSTALHLGPAGPLERTYYRRGLALGTVLQVSSGHLELARALLHELERTPNAYRPLVRSMGVVGEVALAAATQDRAVAAELAWRAGAAYAEAGLRLPALVTWAAAPGPLTDEQAAAVRAARTGTVLPLLDPYLDLHLAVADGDHAAVAVAAARADPRIARHLVGPPGTAGATAQAPAHPAGGARTGGALSVREREITALALEGLANREIAGILDLSTRTVENHMSRALHKLGLRSRQQLRREHV
ncbi:LuxR C-terminal-related transcriptional regulator [Cellulomonas sp. ACRRI]|uniref:helix-turn-helix transcriptional regulator n=1 Tax=Cellulomonas sp. ACRRI TaxID=2918188 RepID=UPI001EF1DE06|nr:LuxR C-terminal-related transcriptional regulator [Cellulomonas sp. ACRRI]MCG7286159.1 LuxR C-terminal-related transcriptional regulator [Cellulomonas sp. ACRRI]